MMRSSEKNPIGCDIDRPNLSPIATTVYPSFLINNKDPGKETSHPLS
jgi:hypothetical protein